MEDRDGKIPLFKWNRVLETVGPQPRPRHGHRAVAIRDLMIVFGGGNEGIHEGLHVFDTATGNWYIPPMNGDHSPGRAAFGFVVDNTRIIAFGGMTEYGVYSNDLYELQASRWEWKYLRPCNTHYQPIPCPRLGHSFNLIGNQVFMFGGLAQNTSQSQPKYLNDLFVLDLRSDGTVMWNLPHIHGPSPPPRESHSAVVYEDKYGRTKLIVYGGMNGNRLGDLWTLHLSTMQWSKEIVCGKVPLPRSLHSATVMSHRMFIFGGWVPLISDEKNNEGFYVNEREWNCSNDLACLNLETMVWEELRIECPEENLPRARAGHSAVAMNSRIYIWSGRDGYRKAWNNQICCKDLWYLEVEKPASVGRIHLMSSSTDSLELNWSPISCVDNYILQIQKHSIAVTNKTLKLEDNSVVPPSPSTIPKSVPVPQLCPKTFSSSVPCSLNNSISPSNVPPSKPTLPKKPVFFQQKSLSSVPRHLQTLPVTNSSTFQVRGLFAHNSSYGKYTTTMVTHASAFVDSQPLNPSSSKPPQVKTKPVVALAKVADPIVITIPPQVPGQQSQVQPKPLISSKSFNSRIPVISRTAIRKPVCNTVSVTRPIASHLPVACAPVPQFSPSLRPHEPHMATSPRPTVPSPNVTKSATPTNNHLSSELMPFLPSAIAPLNNKLQASSSLESINSGTEPAVSVSNLVAQQAMGIVMQANQLTKGSPRTVTLIPARQLQKRFPNGKPLTLQKCPSLKNGPCFVLQKDQVPIIGAKENIPKLSTTSQGGQKTVFKIVKTTQASSAIPPGARLITIKRPVTIKAPNLLQRVSSVVSSKKTRQTPSTETNPSLQLAQSQEVSVPHTGEGVNQRLQSTESSAVTLDSRRSDVSDSSQMQPNSQCNVISTTVCNGNNATSQQTTMVCVRVLDEQRNNEELK